MESEALDLIAIQNSTRSIALQARQSYFLHVYLISPAQSLAQRLAFSVLNRCFFPAAPLHVAALHVAAAASFLTAVLAASTAARAGRPWRLLLGV
eukprot:259983-Pelagomonas_calceolata.AAC.4